MIRFLDSYIIDNEESCSEISEKLLGLEHTKYIVKPNISTSH